MKTLLTLFFVFFIFISSKSYGGLFGITSIEDAKCEDLEKMAKGKKLTNAFGGKFKILQVKNSKEILRTKDKLVCIGELKLDSGFSNSKLSMTLINDDDELWYEFKQEFDFSFNNNENDNQIENIKQISGDIISRSTLLEDVLDCKKINDNVNRLVCYDALTYEITSSNSITIPSITKLIKEKKTKIGGPNKPFYGCIFEIQYKSEDPFTGESEIGYISIGDINGSATFLVTDFEGLIKGDVKGPKIGDCFAFIVPSPMTGYGNYFSSWNNAEIYRGEYLVDEKLIEPKFKEKLTVDEYCDEEINYTSKIVELTGIVKEATGKENKSWFRIQFFSECDNYFSTYYDSDIWKDNDLIKTKLLSIKIGDTLTLKGYFGGMNGFEIIEILN